MAKFDVEVGFLVSADSIRCVVEAETEKKAKHLATHLFWQTVFSLIDIAFVTSKPVDALPEGISDD